ncbi:12312_t:CDS:2, partial [Acaulospora morrowiae]
CFERDGGVFLLLLQRTVHDLVIRDEIMSTKYVTPGRRLCYADNVAAGPGTYLRGEYIYSSVVGAVRELAPSAEGEPRTITVTREKIQSIIPEVDSIVTGRVIRMSTKEAVVSIMVVGNIPCTGDFQGIIR